MLYSLILLLLGGFPVHTSNGEQNVPGSLRVHGNLFNFKNYFDQMTPTETMTSLTLYVRTTGNDTNNCLSAGNSCLTIQEAMDRIPKRVLHSVVVDVGVGNFANFIVEDFSIGKSGGSYASIGVTGVLGSPTLGGGTVSGTADGGSTSQCIDSGQAWVVNELRGRLVLVDGEYRVVRSNDATTMTLVGVLAATCNGKAYELFEQKTVINSGANTGRVYVSSLLFSSSSSLTLTNLFVSGGTIGLFVTNGQGMAKTVRCKFLNQLYGIWHQNLSGDIAGEDNYIENATLWGFGVQRCPALTASLKIVRLFIYGGCSNSGLHVRSPGGFPYFEDIVVESVTGDGIHLQNMQAFNFSTIDVKDCGGNGLLLQNVGFVDVDSATITGNTGYGIYLDENSTGNRCGGSMLNAAGNLTISGNTGGGIIAKNHSTVALTNCDGINVGAFGLELETYSYATITTDTDITGAVGDATINDGTTTLTWATHFNDNGDIAVNSSNLCAIERKD